MIKKLINFTIIGRFFYLANPIVNRFGFSGSVKKIINNLGSKLSVKFKNNDIQDYLRNKPVLLISNHPFMFGIVALIASIPQRSDSHLIINSDYLNVYPNLDKFLIPVYIRHQNYGNWYEKILKLLFDKIFFYPSYNSDVEHQKNIKSIDDAVNKIKKGELVIIFPEKRDQKLRWYKGVGYLIRNLGSSVKYHIIFAHLGGNSRRLDYLRLFPHIGKILSPISINFSECLTLNKVLSKNNDPEQISLELQKEYEIWAKSLNMIGSSIV